MKSVGIKVLKDKLSAYLNYVREGEIVLVTDRDEVIAEIRRPLKARDNNTSRFEMFLNDANERGELTRANSTTRFPQSIRDLPNLDLPVDAATLLEESRAERFR